MLYIQYAIVEGDFSCKTKSHTTMIGDSKHKLDEVDTVTPDTEVKLKLAVEMFPGDVMAQLSYVAHDRYMHRRRESRGVDWIESM